MSKRPIMDTLNEIIQPVVSELMYELVEIEFLKEAGNWYLRVYIDKDGGVSINDCETLSNKLSGLLDEKDPIEQSYYLEVSSPGIERPLKKPSDYKKHIGKLIEVKLYKPLNGEKLFEGKLTEFTEDIVVMEHDKHGRLEFQIKDIALTKPVIKI